MSLQPGSGNEEGQGGGMTEVRRAGLKLRRCEQKPHGLRGSSRYLCMLGMLLLLGGCANQGSLVDPGKPTGVVDFTVRMAGPVDETAYYFLALDTVDDGGATFPVPVAAGPYWGNGWGTGTITHYLEYHMGQYRLFRTQLNTVLTARSGGFLSISGSAAGSTAGVYRLTVLSVSGTTATVRSVFTLAATGQTFEITDTLESNTSSVTTLVPGLTINTGDLAEGDAATIAVQLSPGAVQVDPAYFQYTLPAGGTELHAIFDLESLGTDLTNLSFNFITTTQLIYDPTITNPRDHVYDGLGPLGNDAIRRNDPRQFLSFSNDTSLIRETAGDVTLEGPATQPQKNAVDIVDWTLSIRRLR
jgi:hypothetical protein